jgi:threonine dehydrogenase-like Zn-dependent dehydrogenase
VGHSAVVREAVAVAAPFGQVVLLGSPRVPVETNMTPLLSEVHTKFLTMRGALEWCLPIYPTFGAGVSQHEKQEMIFAWLAAGTLNLGALVSHRLAPEKISEAYEGLETQPAVYTGVALNWGA